MLFAQLKPHRKRIKLEWWETDSKGNAKWVKSKVFEDRASAIGHANTLGAHMG